MRLGRVLLFHNIINMAVATSGSYKFIDIGANLTDPVYQGIYHSKLAHPPDLDGVLQRSYDIGVKKIIVTGGCLSDCEQAIQLAHSDDHLYCTVGVHPTRCGEFERTEGMTPQQYMKELLAMISKNKDKVVAIGECGLDYDRLHFCGKPIQQKYFEEQLIELSDIVHLPLFLHCRSAFNDFMDIMKRNKNKIHSGGVIHSFDGTLEEMKMALEFGLYIGVNGCSLKTITNLQVVKEIPPERLLLETDAPWCEIRPTHASAQFVSTHFPSKKKERWESGTSVKNRNEPRNIMQVLEVVAAIQGKDKQLLAEQIYKNTCTLFKLDE